MIYKQIVQLILYVKLIFWVWALLFCTTACVKSYFIKDLLVIHSPWILIPLGLADLEEAELDNLKAAANGGLTVAKAKLLLIGSPVVSRF